MCVQRVVRHRKHAENEKKILDWRIRTTDLMMATGVNLLLQSPALPTELSRDSDISGWQSSIIISE